jgi:hypothetical protein
MPFPENAPGGVERGFLWLRAGRIGSLGVHL